MYSLDTNPLKVKVLVAQSFPTPGDPVDCSPPGSSGHEILQARILEWLPCPSPGDHSDPGFKSRSPVSQAGCLHPSRQGSPSPWSVSYQMFRQELHALSVGQMGSWNGLALGHVAIFWPHGVCAVPCGLSCPRACGVLLP